MNEKSHEIIQTPTQCKPWCAAVHLYLLTIIPPKRDKIQK